VYIPFQQHILIVADIACTDTEYLSASSLKFLPKKTLPYVDKRGHM
jgi:hypothetical protein